MLITGNLEAVLLLIIFGAQIPVARAQNEQTGGVQAEAAMLPNAPSSSEKLTLAAAVDLALKQNLDIQVANIETASKQQDRLIARSKLIPHARFDANDAVTRYNTRAQLGVQPSIIPHEVGPYQSIHVGPTFSTPIFDLTLIHQYQVSGYRLLASRADEQAVREETVLLAVSEYMAHLRAFANNIPLIIRALGQPLIMVPLSAVTTSGMAKGRESGAASALFNIMRNIGGSIGIAGLSTLLSVRERFHSERNGESVTVYSGAVQERMQHSAAYFLSLGSDSYSANMRTIGAIGSAVRRQAFLLAYGDCFLVLGCALLASATALLFMKKTKSSGALGGH